MPDPAAPSHPSGPLLVEADWFERATALREEDPIFGAMAVELQRRCDELLEHGRPKYLDPDDLESRWWKSRMGGKQLVVAVWDLALAGRLFAEPKYAELAVRILDNLVEHNLAENSGGSCYGRPYKTWFSDLDASHAVESLGLALDLLRPHLDATHGRTIAQYLLRFVEFLAEKNATRGDEDRPVLINATLMGKVGTGEGAAALETWGLLDASEHLAYARTAAIQYLEEGGHEDGLLIEGPMYGFACLKLISILGGMLAQRGDRGIWDCEGWDRIVEAYCSQMIPCDGTLNILNDGYPPRLTSWLLAVAGHRRNGLARWLWEQVVRPLEEKRWDAPVAWDDIRAPWWHGLVPHAMLSYDPSVEPRSPREMGLSPSRHFAVRGVVDVRTGWDEEDFFVTMTCCPDIRWRNRVHRQHAQADRGHFSLFALGERFLIDVGYGNEVLSGSTEVMRLGHTGEAHSVPEVDGAMQKGVTLAGGFHEVLLDAWAPLARMEFSACYERCLQAFRSLAVIPDADGVPLYVVVHDFMSLSPAATTLGSLFQVDAEATVRTVEREAVDLIGGQKGNRCRLITTANRPGRFMVDEFTGHPRLRFQFQDASLNTVTLLIPYRKDEAPPVFRRTTPDRNEGFAGSLEFRGVNDRFALNVVDRFADEGLETDAAFTLVRKGDPDRLIAIDGSSVTLDGRELLRAERRGVFVV